MLKSILSEWSFEIDDALEKSKSFCIAIFSIDKELLFSNEAFNALISKNPIESFINPTFDQIVSLQNKKILVFDGFLTLGDFYSVNTSIVAQIYRKENKLLIIGGVNTMQLIEQNILLHQSNREISNLQRDLIKKTHTLENTLSKLNEVNQELNKTNADKDRFMQILGHDLRSPFTTLIGFSGLLANNLHKYDIDKIDNYVGLIQKTAKRTYDLLEDLLLWSKSQSGKIPFEPQEIYLHEMCKQIIETLEENANAKKITIQSMVSEELVLIADLNMLKTIIRNLISNAIKFSYENGQINIFAQSGQFETIVTVFDNGVGMNEEDQLKLWKMTSQHTTLGTAKEKGTGLGLMLCKEFVENHNGRIWVESKVGEGCAFKFTIPAKTEIHNC